MTSSTAGPSARRAVLLGSTGSIGTQTLDVLARFGEVARLHGIEGWPGTPAVERRLWALAQQHVDDPALPAARIADYTQAQMDFGATLCTPRRPACVICPMQDICIARLEGRQVFGKVVVTF